MSVEWMDDLFMVVLLQSSVFLSKASHPSILCVDDVSLFVSSFLTLSTSQMVLGVSRRGHSLGRPLNPMGHSGVQHLSAQMKCKSHNKCSFKGSLLRHNVIMV